MAKTQVWVCTSGTDYEGSGVEAVYADVHGARSWLTKQRRRVIREARKPEREFADMEKRKTDYSGIRHDPLQDAARSADEGFRYSDQWYRITPWTVQP